MLILAPTLLAYGLANSTSFYSILFLSISLTLAAYLAFNKKGFKRDNSNDLKCATLLFTFVSIMILILCDSSVFERILFGVTMLFNINILLVLMIYKKEYGDDSIQTAKEVFKQLITNP